MKKNFRLPFLHLVFATAFSLICGCASYNTLPLSQTGNAPAQNILNLNDMPIGLEVKASDFAPMAKFSMFSELVGVSGGNVTTYPLKSVVESAFRDGIKANLRSPKPGEIPPCTITVSVNRSELRSSGNTANYNLEALVELRDQYSQPFLSRSLNATTSSAFDGKNQPQAVNDATRSICEQFMKAIAADTQSFARLKDKAPIGNIYECDMRVLDLQGRRVIGVSGKVTSPSELRTLSETLADQLLEKWSPKDSPKVSVIEFATTGTKGDPDLGKTFAVFVEEALGKKSACKIADRKRLDAIMQEHDLRAAEIARNPAALKKAQIPIETVEFFVTGQIAVISSR